MEFIKAQGLGNDFVMLVNPEVAKDRDNSINVRFFNADGSEAESCGNGSRCIAKYLMQQKQKNSIILETLGGTINCQLENDMVTVEMPVPKIEILDGEQSLGHLSTPDAVSVNVGNPHLVCFVDNVDLVGQYGEGLENHPAFPLRTNVDFVRVINSEHLQLKVWERGTGVTPACGSGACASMVAAYVHKKVGDKAKVSQTGGDLWISWNGKKLFMTGPANIVYTGNIFCY